MSDVFISYKAEDRARVAPLVDALQAEGLSVWWDAHIGGGDQWRETIARQLDEAACVLVVWSKRSIGPDGRFVRDEATRALRRGAYLPVRIDKVDPPLGFGETQALPLIGWKGDRSDSRFGDILDAARSMVGLDHQPRHAGHKAPGVARRPLLIGGGGAALAAVGIGGWLALRPEAAGANSIAVLPFANLSGDPTQSYFSDGLAEELRSALSRIAGLQVVARTSSEMLRDIDVKTAARKLGVNHILSGSVRRSPSTIRVNAQLVDGGNGIERWSESFDRAAGDVLDIQTSIAQNVAQALSIELGGKARDVLNLGGTDNPAALDLYLRSNPGNQSDTKEAMTASIGLLNSAIALDPNFAQAHSRKAFVTMLFSGVYSLSAAEAQRGYREAMASVERAIQIEPRLASAYSTRATIRRDQLNIGAALVDLRKAESLPGADAHTMRNHALILGQSRMFDEARLKIDQAKRADPLNPVSLEIEAMLFAFARNYPEALATVRRSIALGKDRVQVRRILGNSLLMLGRTEEAAIEYAKIEPNDYRRLLGEALVAARTGRRNEALDKLHTMERRYGDAAFYQYAEIYAQLNMVEPAIAALQKALEARDPGIAHIRVDAFVDPLRNDPRFAAIEEKLNFPRI